MKRYYFVIFVFLLLFACETTEEKDQIIITAELPAEIKLGQKDTLKFAVSALRPMNTIQLRELVTDADTTTWVSIGSSILSDSTYSFNANFIYDPAETGEKHLFLYVRAAEIYTEYYDFYIIVTK